MKQCSLCDRTEKTHVINSDGICTTCYQALYYWSGATPSQLMKRSRQIQSFQNRMDVLLGNVRNMPKRKRA